MSMGTCQNCETSASNRILSFKTIEYPQAHSLKEWLWCSSRDCAADAWAIPRFARIWVLSAGESPSKRWLGTVGKPCDKHNHLPQERWKVLLWSSPYFKVIQSTLGILRHVWSAMIIRNQSRLVKCKDYPSWDPSKVRKGFVSLSSPAAQTHQLSRLGCAATVFLVSGPARLTADVSSLRFKQVLKGSGSLLSVEYQSETPETLRL